MSVSQMYRYINNFSVKEIKKTAEYEYVNTVYCADAGDVWHELGRSGNK